MVTKSLTLTDLLKSINKAIKFEDIVDIKGNWEAQFNDIIKEIHPDRCKEPGVTEALTKLTDLRDRFVKGVKYKDENGGFVTTGYKAVYKGNPDIMRQCLNNYQCIKHDAKAGSPHLVNYLPSNINGGDDNIEVLFENRSIPLSKLTIGEEHVRWVLSRMLEFSVMLHKVGYIHAGLNPESVYVVPETHGIIVATYYHSVKINERCQTINALYRKWYPDALFNDKKAVPTIDLELAKKTAIFLLGDKSGTGIRLKQKHNPAFVEFLIAQHTDPLDCYDKYRRLLKDNFETKFYKLDI